MEQSRVAVGNDQQHAGEPRQARALLPTFLLVVGSIILGVYVSTHVNAEHFIANPTQIAFFPKFSGVFSHLGVLVLWTAGVLSVVTGYHLHEPNFAGASQFLMRWSLLPGSFAMLAIVLAPSHWVI